MWDGCSDISVRLQAHKQSGRFRVNGLLQTKHCDSVPVGREAATFGLIWISILSVIKLEAAFELRVSLHRPDFTLSCELYMLDNSANIVSEL
jgi:hypothetical protein